MKKKIVLIAAIAAILSLFAFGTVAYFTTTGTATNIISTGSIAMELHEETDNGEPFPEEGIDGVMPGQDVTKKVYIENTGDSDIYVRVSVTVSASDAEGKALDTSLITLDFDDVNWTFQGGYYYYNSALAAGEMTTDLFTTVSFSTDMGNEYQEATVTVDVAAEATQAANNTDSALTATF